MLHRNLSSAPGTQRLHNWLKIDRLEGRVRSPESGVGSAPIRGHREPLKLVGRGNAGKLPVVGRGQVESSSELQLLDSAGV